jgi:hypothetical protein
MIKKIKLESGEIVTFKTNQRTYGTVNKQTFYYGYIVEYDILYHGCSNSIASEQKTCMDILLKMKNCRYRVKEDCMFAGLEFNGTITRQGTIWNNDTQGQSYPINNCIPLY